MRIGIDARLASYRRGMGNFVYNLLQEIARRKDPYQFIAYVNSAKAADAIPQADNIKVCVLKPAFYPLWEQILLPRRAKQDNLDVLHCTANTAPVVSLSPMRTVITIHDVMYMLPASELALSSSPYQRLGRQYRRWIVPRAARNASLIISDSQYSCDDIRTRLHIPADKIRVVYGSQSPAFYFKSDRHFVEGVKKRYGIKGPLILAIGAIDPRKNTVRVVEAFANHLKSGNDSSHLVIVGMTPHKSPELVKLINDLSLDQNVTLAGFVPEDSLVSLYNAASVFLYPSLYEGFGLPVLEAMACGVPVITASATSIPEIAGGAAKLVDPTDVTAIAQALTDTIIDENLRAELVEKGLRRSKEFSWIRAADETVKAYIQAVQI